MGKIISPVLLQYHSLIYIIDAQNPTEESEQHYVKDSTSPSPPFNNNNDRNKKNHNYNALWEYNSLVTLNYYQTYFNIYK